MRFRNLCVNNLSKTSAVWEWQISSLILKLASYKNHWGSLKSTGSDQFSCSVVSNSSWPNRLRHARLPCSSPSPKVCPSSCPFHPWCHPAISSSDTFFSFCPQSFPASGTFPKSRLFISADQNTGASASASVPPISIQGWFPLRLPGLISLLSKGLVRGAQLAFSG